MLPPTKKRSQAYIFDDAIRSFVLSAAELRLPDFYDHWIVQTLVAAVVGGCTKSEKDFSGVWHAHTGFFCGVCGDGLFYLTRLASTRYFLVLPENAITN